MCGADVGEGGCVGQEGLGWRGGAGGARVDVWGRRDQCGCVGQEGSGWMCGAGGVRVDVWGRRCQCGCVGQEG